MNGRRSLLGFTFCTCYLVSHLTNKVSVRAAATVRGPRHRSCPGLSGPDGDREETDSESTSPELRFRLGGLSSKGGCGRACAKPRAPSPKLTYTLNSWKVEAGGCGLQGHPQLPCEFEASLGYLNPCLKLINTNIRKQTESKQLLLFPQGKKN